MTVVAATIADSAGSGFYDRSPMAVEKVAVVDLVRDIGGTATATNPRTPLSER